MRKVILGLIFIMFLVTSCSNVKDNNIINRSISQQYGDYYFNEGVDFLSQGNIELIKFGEHINELNPYLIYNLTDNDNVEYEEKALINRAKLCSDNIKIFIQYPYIKSKMSFLLSQPYYFEVHNITQIDNIDKIINYIDLMINSTDEFIIYCEVLEDFYKTTNEKLILNMTIHYIYAMNYWNESVKLEPLI